MRKQNRNRPIDTETKLMVAKEEGVGGIGGKKLSAMGLTLTLYPQPSPKTKTHSHILSCILQQRLVAGKNDCG